MNHKQTGETVSIQQIHESRGILKAAQEEDFLDELCEAEHELKEKDLDIEVLEVLPQAAVTRANDEITIHLFDDMPEQTNLQPVMMNAGQNGDQQQGANNASSNPFPKPSAEKTANTTTPQWGEKQSGDEQPDVWSTSGKIPFKEYRQGFDHEEHEEPEDENQDSQDADLSSVDYLNAMFEADAYQEPVGPTEQAHVPVTPARKQKHKKPGKLRQLLFKKQFVFEGSHRRDYGNNVPYSAILLGRAKYLRKIEHQNEPKRRVGRVIGAVALGAAIFAAGIGVGTQINHDTPGKQEVASATTATLHTAPSTTEQQQVTMPVLTAEQYVAFNSMVRWIYENPDKDFSTEFQKAAAAGYFD